MVVLGKQFQGLYRDNQKSGYPRDLRIPVSPLKNEIGSDFVAQ